MIAPTYVAARQLLGASTPVKVHAALQIGLGTLLIIKLTIAGYKDMYSSFFLLPPLLKFENPWHVYIHVFARYKV